MSSNTLKTVLLTLTIATGLSGCMVVVDSDKSSNTERQSKSDWQSEEDLNRRNIAGLTHGQSAIDVINAMGDADFDENIRIEDAQYRVLYYRTHRVKSDGKTTKDECTPIVFRNDELYGWGENQLKVLLSSAN